mmetsp:Transcript_10943/g.16421  ORF Transcript_10943/g.16421 Transcript_10943/m.16421 type:complete len:128 (-) Transcript_10943:170-553(-)
MFRLAVRIQLCLVLVAALIGQQQQTEALQSAFSRRSFVCKVATTGAGAVVASSAFQASANAAEEPRQTRSKTFRGGKEMSDATHNGTDMNVKEAGVAGGLLGKMGLDDITPDKDAGARRSGYSSRSK